MNMQVPEHIGGATALTHLSLEHNQIKTLSHGANPESQHCRRTDLDITLVQNIAIIIPASVLQTGGEAQRPSPTVLYPCAFHPDFGLIEFDSF